jgi:hypothetical protein
VEDADDELVLFVNLIFGQMTATNSPARIVRNLPVEMFHLYKGRGGIANYVPVNRIDGYGVVKLESVRVAQKFPLFQVSFYHDGQIGLRSQVVCSSYDLDPLRSGGGRGTTDVHRNPARASRA